MLLSALWLASIVADLPAVDSGRKIGAVGAGFGLTVTELEAGDAFGSSVANVGDVDGNGLDNPVGSQPSGTLALIGLSTGLIGVPPCGIALPGWGLDGSVGELHPGAPIVNFSAELGPGPGQPVAFALTLPSEAVLAGESILAQGVFVTANPSAAVPLGRTEAIELRLD